MKPAPKSSPPTIWAGIAVGSTYNSETSTAPIADSSAIPVMHVTMAVNITLTTAMSNR